MKLPCCNALARRGVLRLYDRKNHFPQPSSVAAATRDAAPWTHCALLRSTACTSVPLHRTLTPPWALRLCGPALAWRAGDALAGLPESIYTVGTTS